jgi:hypothetical protein
MEAHGSHLGQSPMLAHFFLRKMPAHPTLYTITNRGVFQDGSKLHAAARLPMGVCTQVVVGTHIFCCCKLQPFDTQRWRI